MENIASDTYEIDAVITWVDGNDKDWQNKINQYREIKINFEEKKESVRYNSIGEIAIAIRSIVKFAPFVSNIFLVTDSQQPENFEELQKLASEKKINLELIDHKVIFRGYEEVLPCFNSCSIGSMLFKIPNLSEHFIIFNDDTFLMSETQKSDFFTDGEPIIRGEWKRYYEDQPIRKLYHRIKNIVGSKKEKKVAGFKQFQQTSAKLAGMKKYVRRFHTPVSVRRSTLQNFFEGNDLLRENVKHRFRNENQFIVSSLSEHLELSKNTGHYTKDTQLTYFRSYKRPKEVKQKLNDFLARKKDLFMTFQSLELADASTQKYILDWVDNRIQ